MKRIPRKRLLAVIEGLTTVIDPDSENKDLTTIYEIAHLGGGCICATSKNAFADKFFKLEKELKERKVI